ncbi:MAG: pseudouridine synthase [SAR86 cluster bacterium]|uniref:Pseudouridine synthase n=1 Tax=SAR86 cluster bacterium TaxID=2030880 RepID=A0A2A4WX54_9GAMM|nr:MAG: pseudouridine synthase [SAR86 cluster bacterium]
MGISKYPSKLSLPQINPGVVTVLEYLIAKFPDIEPKLWHQRVAAGKVHWHDGTLVSATSAYQAQQRVYYYREVENEPLIPFEEKVLFQDEHILVAYKPHFLPVTPGGIYVNECLQHRLRDKTGLDDLQALHRLDRATAGLVLFSVKPDTRQQYHRLFKTQQIHKTYHAIAKVAGAENLVGQEWQIKNRIAPSPIRFRMQIVDGEANSSSVIRCLEHYEEKALFELKPITGKTHQLRLHMQSLGFPILHDNYYPLLQPKSVDDYARPLQLLAKELRFIDPVSQRPRVFSSDAELKK